MSAVMLEDLGRSVSVEELRARVSTFDIGSGLRFVTVCSSMMLRGMLEEWANRANPFNLPLLAKAFVLWGQTDGGAQLTNDDGLWLLKAVNSLPWYSRVAAELDTDDSVLRMIIRQGFQRFYTDDPLDARIARTWMMFTELVREGKNTVDDPSGELRKLLGVSAEELWVIGFMIWAFHVNETASDGRNWFFDPNRLVQEGTRQQEMQTLLGRVLQTISRTPDEFRESYAAKPKYRDQTDREGYWVSEFNILRDLPVINLGNGRYASPFPSFAVTRAIDGFYYDLLEEYANRKRASGAGGNPYDNDLSNTLGGLFERYVGRQLRQLAAPDPQLRGEFKYGSKKEKKDSTDWILFRPGRLPVLFECKARESVLDVQRYADLDGLRAEVGKAIAKACKQMAKFIKAIDAKEQGLEQYEGQTRFVCAVILQAPIPFHMVPDIRKIIEEVLRGAEPAWATLRDRIEFVPMSIRELETGVATELRLGVAIEDQLVGYAKYRERASRVERWEDNGLPVFPRHLEEFLQEQYGGGRRVVNPLCTQVWGEFGDFCQRQIFGEGIDAADQDVQELTRKLAHKLWELRDKPLGDDQRDWYEAERLIASDPRAVAALGTRL
jgi:hypothetical protein